MELSEPTAFEPSAADVVIRATGDNPAVDLKLPLLPASAVPADRPIENSDDSTRVGPGARGCFCTAGQRAPRHAPLAWLTLLLLTLRRSRRWRWYALRA